MDTPEIVAMKKRAAALREELRGIVAEIRTAKENDPKRKLRKERREAEERASDERCVQAYKEQLKRDQEAGITSGRYVPLRNRETRDIEWRSRLDASEILSSPSSIYEEA